MAVGATVVVSSESRTLNIELLVTPLIIVISLSCMHNLVQHLDDYNVCVLMIFIGLRSQ